MSTIAQGDSIIDVSDEILDTIETSTIEIEGVDSVATDAVQITLSSESGTALKTETSGSTVLTGESLTGTTEDPASISLVTDGSKEVQTVIVNTASISNTVITTSESVDGSTVAAAAIDISAANVEQLSIKTASTEQKSVIKFDQTTESISDVRVELEGKGGDLTIQTASVEGVQVKASGSEASEITFGSEVNSVANAQIQLVDAGGSVNLEAGTLSGSVIAIASAGSANNVVSIGENVAAVTDTTIELDKGSSTIEVASKSVEDLTVTTSSKQTSTLDINSDNISNFTLNTQKAETNLSLASDNELSNIVLSSTAKKNGALTANIDAVSTGTTITNENGATIDATFAQKAIDPTFTSEGNGVIEAAFDKNAVGVEFLIEKGSVDSTFTGRTRGITVSATATKKAIALEFGKAVKDANLSCGKGADTIVFGGAIKGEDNNIDLGNDGKSDTVTIVKPNKIKESLTITNVGGKDRFIIAGDEFTATDLLENPINNLNIELA